MDQELQHFLISRTEGEALEIVRGAEREPGLEQWRRLAALYDPLAAGGVWTTAGKSCLHQKPPKIDDLSHTIQREGRQSDNSNDGEWWPDEVDLNVVTSGKMSIDSKPVATEGERGRYREITVDSGAGESVVYPDDWATVDLKPSKGSVKGQRHVGPGGETMDNLGELTVKVRTERHGGGDISSRVTFQGA